MPETSKSHRQRANIGMAPNTNFGWETKDTANSLTALAQQVPPTLYAVHLDDGTIKIGHTRKLDRRLAKLGGIKNLLALKPGTRQDENEIHQQLQPHRAHHREYYEPTKEVFALINQWRTGMNLKPINPTRYR